MTCKRKTLIIVSAALLTALLLSVALNVYLAFWSYDSYLQDPGEIAIMEAGILNNNLAFREGEAIDITYSFSEDDYAALREQYKLESIAGSGSELERALRLMNEFSPRLTHKSNYDNHIEPCALSLLAYSLNNRQHGINCRAKAQILNEMCLSLGIFARKVWIMPYSRYDHDCHVVNEIWDTALNKWVMLDITNNQYWVDESGTPLSVLEIRAKGAAMDFCTPVEPGDSLKRLDKLKEKHLGEFLYIMKNMVYVEYLDTYSVGEANTFYLLFPANLGTNRDLFISEESVLKAPF